MPYRYQTIKTIKTDDRITFYRNVIYPDIAYSDRDQYVITTVGDRLDLLANDIYGDTSLWWILASANNLTCDSLIPPIGMQLRIPSNIQQAITNFESVNKIR